MSGIAIAARTIPGKVAPLAIWSSDASERIDSIRRSSATTRAGTRMPRLSSWAIRQRYESTRSRRISSIVSLRHAGRQPRDRRAARPRRSAGGRRLVEEGRMEVLELGVAERAVLGRDVELPRQIGRPPEGLFVEEIAPAADGLSEHHRRGGHVEPAENRQPPPIREPRADQRPDD